MKSQKAKSKKPMLKKRNPTKCQYPPTAAAMLDYLPVLTGQLAIDNAFRGAVSANIVDPWGENFDKLSTADKMKVMAHCVCLAYGGKPGRAPSAESFDSVG